MVYSQPFFNLPIFVMGFFMPVKYLFVMGKRLIISETEKNDIQKMYGLIKEQTENMETLSPAVQIGIKDDYHNNEPVFWDLTQIYRGPTYCEFRGKPRGVSGNWKPDPNYGDGFIYKCKENTFTSNMKGDNREISDEAKKRVRVACGCDQYVKNSDSVKSNVA
jgi:hypothetical protein